MGKSALLREGNFSQYGSLSRGSLDHDFIFDISDFVIRIQGGRRDAPSV
jgi:hypothetical protein